MTPYQIALMFTECSLVMLVMQAIVFSPRFNPATTRWLIAPALGVLAAGLFLVPRASDFTLMMVAIGMVAASAGIAIAKMASAAGVPCASVVTKAHTPYEGIINVAKKQNCDVIFMATHGRRGFSKLVMGSVTQKVLALSTIPVAVYR